MFKVNFDDREDFHSKYQNLTSPNNAKFSLHVVQCDLKWLRSTINSIANARTLLKSFFKQVNSKLVYSVGATFIHTCELVYIHVNDLYK